MLVLSKTGSPFCKIAALTAFVAKGAQSFQIPATRVGGRFVYCGSPGGTRAWGWDILQSYRSFLALIQSLRPFFIRLIQLKNKKAANEC